MKVWISIQQPLNFDTAYTRTSLLISVPMDSMYLEEGFLFFFKDLSSINAAVFFFLIYVYMDGWIYFLIHEIMMRKVALSHRTWKQ